MIADHFTKRRALVCAGATLLFVPIACLSADKSNEGGEPAKAEGDKAPSGKGAAKKGKTAALTVVVTGAGKPISQAEVQLRPPGEKWFHTNQAGEVTFSAVVGTVMVLVIAAGWKTEPKEVKLKEGPQRVTIELTSLQDGK